MVIGLFVVNIRCVRGKSFGISTSHRRSERICGDGAHDDLVLRLPQTTPNLKQLCKRVERIASTVLTSYTVEFFLQALPRLMLRRVKENGHVEE